MLLAAVPLAADGNVTYQNIADDPASGIVFRHGEPPRGAILDGFEATSITVPDDLLFIPHKPHGAPGVAIFDHDRDGDLDIYVTNSVGSGNALFSNQLRETGSISFTDVATAAGVDATDHDSTGVCFGDLDNDGDHDLMVLGAIGPNRLYENQGNGTFLDITASAGVGGGNLSTSSCTMGDVDNDGLLDIAVANTHTDWTNLFSIFIPFDFNEHNQLFVNQGGNVFSDVSAAAGFENFAALPPGASTLTWAIALVDYDLDGDVDAFTLDDQGGVPPAVAGGVDYGLIHLHENDGTGHFTDIADTAGIAVHGNWMGIDFGDLDCDGDLDFFATNTGDYPAGNAMPPNPLGFRASRWFLSNNDGTFADPGVGPLVASVFGWGTTVSDYDNDGDADILYHGAIDVGTVLAASNPGAILQNQGCSGTFTRDADALANGADHLRRIGQGLATGDLDGDGFLDLVTVSNHDFPEPVPLTPLQFQPGGPFDDTANVIVPFDPDPNDPTSLLWNGIEGTDGSLAIEMSSGDNGNRSASVTALGTIGVTSGGRVNRDGIGAVVRFRTPGGKQALVPIRGGSSYASQHALAAHLGFGRERRGTVEVLWPGGVRNRLFGVRAGEQLVFPEIPCDLDTAFDDRSAYIGCVFRSLGELHAAGVIDFRQKIRFLISALLP